MVLSRRRCGFLLAKLVHALQLTSCQAVYSSVGYRCSIRAPCKKYYQVRPEFGAYNTQIKSLLKFGTTDMYKRQLGMTKAEFQSLFLKVRPLLEPKKRSRKGTSISAREQLILTLSYLKSGCSQGYLANQFVISRNRLCEIIKKVVTAIITKMSVAANCRPGSPQEWKAIADRFYQKWQLPNCIGAADGKHCFITKFGKTGSYTINYHGWPSVVLLAVCDADYQITHMNVGSFGGRSDGGIWSEDHLGRGLESGDLLHQGFIPAAAQLPGDAEGRLGKVNYYIVCDDAFKLTGHCIKPYGGKVTDNQRFTNYRLSRGRMTIECTFGHLSRRWKILGHLTTNEKMTRLIVKCLVHLHNFLRISRLDDPDELQEIERQPTCKEIFGRSLSLQPEALDSDGIDSGEVTRKKLHYYFNYVNSVFKREHTI